MDFIAMIKYYSPSLAIYIYPRTIYFHGSMVALRHLLADHTLGNNTSQPLCAHCKHHTVASYLFYAYADHLLQCVNLCICYNRMLGWDS